MGILKEDEGLLVQGGIGLRGLWLDGLLSLATRKAASFRFHW